MQIHKFCGQVQVELQAGMLQVASRRVRREQKTYTRDKEIRLGINFKWDAFPLLPKSAWQAGQPARSPAVDAT